MSKNIAVEDVVFKAVAPWILRKGLEFVQVPGLFVEAAVWLAEVALDEDE